MRAARCADQLDFADFNEVLASGKALGQIALVTPDGEAREVANELGPVAEVVVVEDLPARRGEDESVLWLLSEVPDERGVEGVDAILVQVCEPDELAELAEDTKNSVPWERWAEKHPEIAAATSKADSPIAELLGFEWPGTVPEAATGPRSPARRLAWIALAERRDPIALGVAAESSLVIWSARNARRRFGTS
jgi:hypothetical protein